mmetsp:Transcript_85527/g.226742  ORF Transcript_85527/g.226742 Transcript_85527/m.226742 type:complete len:89 (-) Transcript_85527:309-575(-)
MWGLAAALQGQPALAEGGPFIQLYEARSFGDLSRVELCPVANCPGLADVPPIQLFGTEVRYSDAALAGAVLSFGWKIGGMLWRQGERG